MPSSLWTITSQGDLYLLENFARDVFCSRMVTSQVIFWNKLWKIFFRYLFNFCRIWNIVFAEKLVLEKLFAEGSLGVWGSQLFVQVSHQFDIILNSTIIILSNENLIDPTLEETDLQRRAATRPQWMQFLSGMPREKLTEQFSVFSEKSRSLSIIHLLVPPSNPSGCSQICPNYEVPFLASFFFTPRCEDGGVLEGSPLVFCDGSRWNGSAPHCMRES